MHCMQRWISENGTIQDFQFGGGKHGGSRMIVVCESTSTHTYACVPTRGLWGACSHRNLDPLRLLLTQSGTRLLFNTCDKALITILNFKISGRGRGGREFQAPPLYETLGTIGIVNQNSHLLKKYVNRVTYM